MSMTRLRRLCAEWRYEAITQTTACDTLRTVSAGLPPPRVIYREPDGREVMANPRVPMNRWQRAANRILRKRPA